MAKPSELPIVNITAGTAFKAGFFGAIGFLFAQVIIVPAVLLVLVIFGVTIGSVVGGSVNTASRWQKMENVQTESTDIPVTQRNAQNAR